MKTYKQINNESIKVLEAIKAAEAEIDALSFADEKTAAIRDKRISDYKEIKAAADENAEKIAAICDHLENLKIKQQILRANRKAAVFNEGLPVLLKAFEKYEGKQYGTATKEKIYSEVRAAGARCSEKYVDNINKRVKELKKAYNDYKTAAEKARAAESHLNSLIPSTMNHYNKIGHISGGLI